MFHKDGEVKALHNDINRNWYYEEEYYTPIEIINGELSFKAVEEENRPYENLIVKQIGSDYRAVVTSFVSRTPSTGFNVVKVMVTNETGTLLPNNDIYIFAPALESAMFLKTDFEYGVVSHSIGSLTVEDSGALYTPGNQVDFHEGSGVNVDAFISEVTGGGVEEIKIVNKGYGYSVGDQLLVTEEGYGGMLDAVVSKIDGLGADIKVTSELNDLIIVDDGQKYKVNDELEIVGGVRTPGTPPARIRVTAVDDAWALVRVLVSSSGSKYPRYSKVALIDTSTTTKVGGFSAFITFTSRMGIGSVVITAAPSGGR